MSEVVNDIVDEAVSQPTEDEQQREDRRLAMVCVLHTNKADDDHNMRGHLGTMLAQKAGTVLECKKDKVAQATMGELKSGDKTGPAVKTIKLLAQSTGDFTREELKKDVKFGWTDKARAEIAAAKNSLTHSPSPTGEGSGNTGGSNSGGNTGGDTGDNSGGDNGGGNGSGELDEN